MLDIDFIRKNPDLVKEKIAHKGFEPKLVNSFLRKDNEWRERVSIIDKLRTELNLLSRKISKDKADDLLSRAQILKEQLKKIEEERKKIEEQRKKFLSLIPNIYLEETPIGGGEKDNVVLREKGKKPEFDFIPKDYLSIGENLQIIDIERSAKTSGARFGSLLEKAALLEFSLINFSLKRLRDENFIKKIIKKNKLKISSRPFILIIPPVLINRNSIWAMGYLSWAEQEVYHLEKDDLYLVGTSEQSIGARHQQEVFEKNDLPKRYLGFSSCFRREAGSYGKDTKGIFRVHQFDKLEMFSFCLPDDSKQEHQLFLAIEEALMDELKLAYRVLRICSGDLGGASAAKYDIEAWFPSENKYRETHSASNCTDYQARRLNIKYNDGFVHTVNGTVFALGRIISAIIENYQTKDEDFEIPFVLQ